MRLRRTFDDPDSEEVVVLRQGDIFVVPKGTQHCPGAENEVSVLMAESKGELNTGDLGIT
jgi:mannose-6-phosphate isomerase-like protein (cupin superfamily)